MCALFHPSRGGVRGGRDHFDWEAVKSDKDRECYLGHSLKASVGRWQKGRDIMWYTRKSDAFVHSEEFQQVKKLEEKAMLGALGLKCPDDLETSEILDWEKVLKALKKKCGKKLKRSLKRKRRHNGETDEDDE